MFVQIVESPSHREVKQTHTVGAHQVKVCSKLVIIFGVAKFAAIQPFQAERQNPSLGEVYTPLLLVLDCFPQQVLVPIHIQDRRYLACQILGLVENSSRLKPRDDLVSKLPHPVSVS